MFIFTYLRLPVVVSGFKKFEDFLQLLLHAHDFLVLFEQHRKQEDFEGQGHARRTGRRPGAGGRW